MSQIERQKETLTGRASFWNNATNEQIKEMQSFKLEEMMSGEDWEKLKALEKQEN